MDAVAAEAERFDEVVQELLRRWPENQIEPSLGRISALMDLIGDPQLSYPVIQLTGTNGKSSTARMIDSLLRAFGLRTGLYTSPHLVDVTERIEIDGAPIDRARFVAAADDIAAYIDLIDDRSVSEHGTPLTFFEAMTALAFSAFADAPVDAAVVEVGLGGTWDATSVTIPQVCVITGIDLDHTEVLGPDVASIAAEKAGIVKAGSFAVIGEQPDDARRVIEARLVEVGAGSAWLGREIEVVHRDVAVGGQLLTLRGLAGEYDEIFLPMFGAHQAANAALALAAVEAFLGGGTQQIDVDTVREGFAAVHSPGRAEVVRRGPTVIVDAAHNPAGAQALAATLAESFAFTHVVGVLAVLREKDVRGILVALEPVLDEVVVTVNASPRTLPVDDLAALAVEVFGEERVEVCTTFADAIDTGVRLAEEADTYAASGVVVTGSVVTAGQARALIRRRG